MRRRANITSKRLGAGVKSIVAWCLFALPGCAAPTATNYQAQHPERLYPRPPQTPWVAAVGGLETRSEPTQAQVQIALVLFGEEPQPATGLVKPGALAMRDADVLIADSPVSAVFRHQPGSSRMDELRLGERPKLPAALCVRPGGNLLVADAHGAGVIEFDARGDVVRRYGHRSDLRPAGIVCTRDEIWISDLSQHCIEIYDARSGAHLRQLGERGAGRLQFSFPMGMALTPGGDVCIVDMMNHRVQVVSPQGKFIRAFGQAGDCAGCFGRPRDVAVGPDGTVFVTDSACSRVHAFNSDGKPLLAFGDPDGGVGALLTPSGITVSTMRPGGSAELPEGFEPAYYVLVSEQMLEPGVRVYAWRSRASARNASAQTGAESAEQAATKRTILAKAAEPAINPHWSAANCSACHQMDSGRARPIPADQVDSLCLSCHDGNRAASEAHPVGRLANSQTIKTPADWPSLDGRLGCATCHDIRQHCDTNATRPDSNPAMVRGFNPDRPSAYCTTCHQADPTWRFSPHEQLRPDGGVKEQSCLFCHTRTPEVPKDNRRTFQAGLKSDSAKVCLTCHVRHWDVSPTGHVDRPVTPAIKRRLVGRELTGSGMSPGPELLKAMADPTERSRRLPLSQERVTCFTCHNPHQKGLFPAGSELGRRAEAPEDAAVALRMNRMELCVECHRK